MAPDQLRTSGLILNPQSANMRLLMIAFHFPPQAGSSGVLRTLNFVKNLPRHGWQPIVLSANPRAYAEQSNNLVSSIPVDTPVFRVFSLDAARHLSIANRYPRLAALPDRWSTWWLGGVIQGLRIVREKKPDLIWSTYPISTAHLIGATLSRLTGLPWVVDFRDPMVSTNYPSDRLQRRIWRWIESYAVKRAVACIFTTLRAAQEYSQRYPGSSDKCLVIENGYDEEAFQGLSATRFEASSSAKLLILHSGLIYPDDRNPSTFFSSVADLINQKCLDRRRLRIRFRAAQHTEKVIEFARQHNLEDIVEVPPALPYREAIAEMMEADLLLVFQGSKFNAQIPAKIYEYLRSQKTLLAVLDPTGDTAAQLRQFHGVLLADIQDPKDISNVLRQWLRDMGSDAVLQAQVDNLQIVKQYSRAAQAASLARVLDQRVLKKSK